ncbi:MAG: cell filamentation protein Fic [Faecalibacterium sp. CAG:74_58_120]|nr:MAG: cell filamentation protein Fic [Faecalibacterium sp. CAG:74_58_120]
MREFHYAAIREQKWDSEILGLIAAIYKEAGKQEMYLKQRPEELEKLVEIAKIQSTEASNAIEGIVTTSTRIRQLVEEKTTPRNRDEQEIAGYRDALSVIHENFDVIPITRNYILQLHKILYSHMNNPMAGQTKSVQNYISATYPDGHTETLFTPLAPFETPEALDCICEEYNRATGNLEVEPLILIPVFIHDFLCIHPFNDGNGRMSRLLTTLLLYRSGFYVGKYISLEAKIAKNKDLYYDALRQSQTGWHDGREDAIPFIKYLLGIVLSAYRDFEERFSLVEKKQSALEMVRQATLHKIGRFTKQDIRELCPSLSVSSVEGALRKLVASGELAREGSGKSTCYYRLK